MPEPTQADQYFAAQLAPVLAADEKVLAGAYLKPVIRTSKVSKVGRAVEMFGDAASKRAAYLAITSKRLVAVETRIGAFSEPLLENLEVRSIDRAEIRGAHVGRDLLIELADGSMLQFKPDASTKHVSTQAEFFNQLVPQLGRSETAAAQDKSEASSSRWATIIGIAIAAAYLAYKLHGS